MEASSVIAAAYDLRVQRGADFELEFQAEDASGNLIDWSLVPEVRINVANAAGIVFTSYLYGDGLTVDETNSNILRLVKNANEKNITPGTYNWDMKVKFSTSKVRYPVRGRYFSVDYVTA